MVIVMDLFIGILIVGGAAALGYHFIQKARNKK